MEDKDNNMVLVYNNQNYVYMYNEILYDKYKSDDVYNDNEKTSDIGNIYT